MSKIKKHNLVDVENKQKKISQFFIQSSKTVKVQSNDISIKPDLKKSHIDNNVNINSKDVNVNTGAVSNEPKTEKSPLKECGNLIDTDQEIAHDRPTRDLEKSKEVEGEFKKSSSASPDIVPPTPTTNYNKRINKKGIKRKNIFPSNGSTEKECISNKISKTSNPEDIKSSLLLNENEAVGLCSNSIQKYCTSNDNLLISEIKTDTIKIKGIDMQILNNVKANHDIGSNSADGMKRNDEITTNKHTNSLLKSPVKITSLSQNELDEFCSDDLFLEDLKFDNMKENKDLSLGLPVRCQVTSVQMISDVGELVLGLKSDNSNQAVTCVLCDIWATCKINVDDIVMVSAKPIDGQPGCWRVDNEGGMVVLHPDILISGTTLVGSLFCMRRAVLSDGYRGMDSDSKIMIIGSLLHTLLQEVLKRNISTQAEISKVVEEIMSRKNLLFTLYGSTMKINETKTEVETFVPLIYNFVNQYLSPEGVLCAQQSKNSDGWKGKITSIADIEENIWAPNLGLKGKIDVTVNVKIHSRKKVMPLELKTGRASFSSEHRGQVILYTMMMSELGTTVDSGLLLYLREGVMKEVSVGHAERRDLTILRNQLVYHLEANKRMATLPDPISHRACGKCPYLTICSAALRVKGMETLAQSNPLNALFVTSTEHLDKDHIEYAFHWSRLIRLEQIGNENNKINVQDIWLKTPEEREKNGTCISNVKILGCVKEVSMTHYEHVFTWNDTRRVTFNEGEYLIVSSAKRIAVAAGTVRYVSDSTIVLQLERDLSLREESTWHLDSYESYSLHIFNLTNLGYLLDDTDEAKQIRELIVSLRLPRFAPKLSSKILKIGADLLASLNPGQKSAVFQSVAAEEYVLIKGMPGTGKTATIVSLVQLAVRLKQSVLVTSHTHSAVDNVLLRLKGKIDFLRLGSSARIHPDLISYAEDNHSCSTPEELEAFYNSKSVVGVTCLGSSHPLLRRRRFDLCLVDEATQVLQPTVLRPLFAAKKFILVGDPDQLSPLVRSQEAKNLGLGVSLFERLDRPAVTTVLSLQYRMNDTLTKLANHLTYNGTLVCGNEAVKNATLKLDADVENFPTWMKLALSTQLEDSIVVLDTGNVTSNSKCSNQVEGDIVLKLLTTLKEGGVLENNIGVIAPYREQVSLLQQLTTTNKISVEVNTVDQYQGRDKDVIIYSCTRNVQAKDCDILSDQKRMTVAITRARHKLIFIGNTEILKGYTMFKKIFDFISNSNIIHVNTAKDK